MSGARSAWPVGALLLVLGACERPRAGADARPRPQTTPAQLALGQPPLDSSCRSDGECVPAPSCCPAPCTSEVINVKDMPRAQQQLAACPKGGECPSAGGCRTHAYLCVAGRCALVFEGDAAYHAR